MRILHICNDFTGSKVHSSLYQKLDDIVDSQFVYTYFDGEDNIGKNQFDGKRTNIVYDDILNPYLRKVYPIKMWWVYRHLLKHIEPNEIDCVHATTLFSDGGIAYKLYKEYGIPYVVAVRTTDLGTYINKSKMLWEHGRKILKHASKIILINKCYEERMKTLEFSKGIWEEIKDRVVIQPNGIDQFWIDNVTREQRPNSYKICYVGTFIRRKNIPRLIQAVDLVYKEFPQVSLELIGGGGSIGNEDEKVRTMAEERPYVTIIGRISDKSALKDKYRECSVFAMPSWSETFGLVYIEALTQNIRLLYSKNDGIDGLLDNVGVAVDPYSVDSIANGLRQIVTEYGCFEGNKDVDFSLFDWTCIADRYCDLYKSIVNNNQ